MKGTVIAKQRPWLAPAAAIALVLVGAIRIAATYTVFSATADEATHTGAGLELIQYHRYELQPANPPLPRVVFAAAPSVAGIRYDPQRAMWQEQSRSIFHEQVDYVRALVLARVGNLLFFIVAAATIWFWSHRSLGEWGAVLAVGLFTFQPIVLGHSGLATHDAAATAGLAVSLLALSSWLRKPDLARAAILGAAFGFSILCKFSSIAFVPVACAAIYAVRLAHDAEARRRMPRALATIAIVPLVAFLVIWAGYAFTVGTVGELAPWRAGWETTAGELFDRIDPATPLPAPRFFTGFADLLRIDKEGHVSYLFGRVSEEGWWWYFPIAMLLKTPLAFLLLIPLGFAFAWRMPPLRNAFLESIAAAAAIVVVASQSTLDLGVRYVLPAYVPLSVAAAAAALAMFRHRRPIVRGIAVAALALYALASAAAHPDYFPYFNLAAGRDPSRYLIDSNLDWGQDVLRLRRVLEEKNADKVGLALFGNADYEALGFPPTFDLHPSIPAQGWVAISDHAYRIFGPYGWWWLRNRPYERVGTSIRLYYVP